ncbi:MAG: hypothetical protein LBH19_01520, partial [Dysgonamonadaceae bacterium]|nr:hypothetical protein [Dysgonamonadaceae bacterium]
MKKFAYLLIVVQFFVYETVAQMQDPDNAVQLSHDFDQHQGRLAFYSDNRDFCDYYLYVTFVYAEGFEGITTGAR